MARRALPPAVHRWARRSVGTVRPNAADREVVQLRADVPVVLRRLAIHGQQSTVTASDLSRMALTRLQTELRESTEISVAVAQDEFLQQFRKHLHLLLDH